MASRNLLHTQKQKDMLLKTIKTNVHPRKLARSIAHNQFKLLGYDNVDKPFFYRGHLAPSYFSTHWRTQVSNNKIIWDNKKKAPVIIKNV